MKSLVLERTDTNQWLCSGVPLPPNQNSEQKTGIKGSIRYRHTPMVVFGEPRSGSNLFFDFLALSRYKANPNELDLVVLNELFIKDEVEQARSLALLTDAIKRGCNSESQGPNMFSFEQNFRNALERTPNANPQSYIKFVKSHTEGDEWMTYGSLFRSFESRNENPFEWIEYIQNIPSRAKWSFFAFKVFSEHLEDLSLDPPLFIGAMEQKQVNGKYIVLWRRRIIESFVSYKIALNKRSWITARTSARDSIHINKKEFEDFIAKKKMYYEGIRDSLLHYGLPFEVFEYDRDLSDMFRQL